MKKTAVKFKKLKTAAERVEFFKDEPITVRSGTGIHPETLDLKTFYLGTCCGVDVSRGGTEVEALEKSRKFLDNYKG